MTLTASGDGWNRLVPLDSRAFSLSRLLSRLQAAAIAPAFRADVNE